MKLYHTILNTVPRPILIKFSYLFRKIAPLLYNGNQVECPVCEHSFSKFLPYGYNDITRRDNVLCPYCLSLERHRLMWIYLKNETDFFTTSRKQKMLHIAPEQCFYDYFKKQKNLDYLTGDLESPIADLHFDLHDIPLEDNRFDVVMCNHVLEHVRDDKQCMRELYRVMAPGGMGIFQVPIDYNRETTLEDPAINTPELREKYYWQKDHVRLYGKDYPKRLEEAGFKVETVAYQSKLGNKLTEKYRLNNNEKIYICKK